jgi:hypothetical protein
LDKLFQENVSIEAALRETIQGKGVDPRSGANLKYYYEPGEKKTLTELLN